MICVALPCIARSCVRGVLRVWHWQVDELRNQLQAKIQEVTALGKMASGSNKEMAAQLQRMQVQLKGLYPCPQAGQKGSCAPRISQWSCLCMLCSFSEVLRSNEALSKKCGHHCSNSSWQLPQCAHLALSSTV